MQLTDVSDPIALARQMIDIPSVSGQEGPLADAVEAALRDAGFGTVPALEILRDGDAVCARTRLGRGQRLILAGHLDTVPIADNVPGRREERDGVEMPGENHALVEAETSPRAHGVTVAQDLQGWDRSESGIEQGRLDGVSQGPFVSRHRGNVDHLARELDRVRQVRQLHGSSFMDASRIPACSPTCVFPPSHQGTPTPRS